MAGRDNVKWRGAAVLRKDIGRRVKILREGHSWSQAALAKITGYHVNTIKKAEKGGDVEFETYHIIAQALDVDMAALFVRNEKRDSPTHDRMCDHDELMSCLMQSSIGPDKLITIEMLVHHYARAYGSVAPKALFPHIAQRFQELKGVLAAPQSVQIRRKAVQLMGALASIAGNLSHDLGDNLSAHSYFELGKLAAVEAEDPDLGARVLATQAVCSYFGGQLSLSVQLAEQAATFAILASSARRRAWISALHARSLAAAGRAMDAQKTLDQSAGCLAKVQAAETPTDFFDVARFDGMAGVVYSLVGDNARALDTFHRALEARSRGEAKGRTLITIDLALHYIRLNEPERAVNLVLEALQESQDTMIAPIAAKVRALRKDLAPWHGSAFVRDLDLAISTTYDFSAGYPA